MLSDRLLSIWNATGRATLNKEPGIHGHVLAECSYEALKKSEMIKIILESLLVTHKSYLKEMGQPVPTEEEMEYLKERLLESAETSADKILAVRGISKS